MRYQLRRLSTRAMQGLAASLVELDRQLERRRPPRIEGPVSFSEATRTLLEHHGFLGSDSSYEYAVARRRFKEALARLRASLRQEDHNARTK